MLKKDVYELTNPQKNIWQMEQVTEKGSSINHILTVMKLKGKLDEKLLDQTLNKIIEVNDSFRIKFVEEKGKLKQYIESYTYTPIEVTNLSEDNIESVIEEYKDTEITINKPYKFSIVFTPSNTYIFYKSHHIIADAWGMTQVAEQIKEIYEKLVQNEDLSEYKKPSYMGLIEREQNYLKSNKYEADMHFWEDYVKNIKPSKLFKNYDVFDTKASRYSYVLEDAIFDGISNFCAQNSITEYSFFLAIIAIYFNKIFSLNNIAIGTPFLNRQKRLGELESTGLYVTTLPLNICVSNDGEFVSLCKEITGTNLGLYKHSGFPHKEIQKLHNKYANNIDKLYDIGFSYQINKLTNNVCQDTGECEWFFSGEQNQSLTIHISTLNNYKQINYDYLNSCFTEEEIKKANTIILGLISQVINDGIYSINKMSTLTAEDVKELQEFNNTGDVKHVNYNVIDVLEKQVKAGLQSTAIVCGDEEITYQKFYDKVTRLANYLIIHGVGKNSRVALLFDKSINMIIAMFAVLKAGGCYIPILPNENEDRANYILSDCEPTCILTHKEYATNLQQTYKIINIDKIEPINCSDTDLHIEIAPEQLAYIIYTSGSTGAPKGTMVTHKNICSLMLSIENDSTLKATKNDVSMSLLKYSFDASGIDIYTALLFGGKLVLVEKEDELNPEKVVKIIEKHRVTRSFLIPKWLEHIALQDKLIEADLSSLKILGTGGETLRPYVVEHLVGKYSNLKILNLYGPTEATMFTTYKVIGKNEIKNNYTTIGRPIYGSRMAIINSCGEFKPINSKGELIIYEDETSIENIANGYLKMPEQTKEKFIEIYHPILKKTVKAYKTGDIAKIRNNLEIEFVGRTDDIVKINGGYLVALNEIENKINEILGEEFTTYPIAVPFQNTKIVVLFVKSNNSLITLKNIKKYINNNISFYMRPKKIIKIDEFPLNSSGKIDRKKLKEIAENYLTENKGKIVLPETKTEKEIYEIIKNFIDTDLVSVTDDFIDDLGLDSLTLTSMYSALEKYDINIQDLYSNPNIKDLASFIDGDGTELKPDLRDLKNAKIKNDAKEFDMSTVLITGVTGYLGIHLLHDVLLLDNVKKVYCIIRDKINISASQRFENMVKYYYDTDQEFKDKAKEKLNIVNGDITKKFLGVDKKTYRHLKYEVTTVINSAANVKHYAKPRQIRKDNVVSVDNLIEFCGNTKSLAHISTLSIAGFSNEKTENKVFNENALYIGQSFSNNPYLISKFEAEKNILIATNKNGLNAKIFRLGNIMPRISDGLFQENYLQNVFITALKTLLDMKMIPTEFNNLKIEFSPVDECAKMIVGIIQAQNKNTVYHVLNDKEISILEFKGLIKNLNYDIVDVDFETFVKTLTEHCDTYTKEYILNSNLNEYSQGQTQKVLESVDLEWSKIDLDYLIKIIEIIKKF